MDEMLGLLQQMSATIQAQGDTQARTISALDTLSRISAATTRLCCAFAESLGASGQLSPDVAEQCADALSDMADALEEQFGLERLPPDLAVRLQSVAQSLRV